MNEQQVILPIAFAETHQGCMKPVNEDSYVINEKLGLYLVIDGMGGHKHGVLATQMIAEHFQSQLAQRLDCLQTCENCTDQFWISELEHVIEATNGELYKKNKALGYSEGRGMGGVIAGLFWLEKASRAIIFHIGDSRVYLSRDQELSQLTEDHSWYQQWLNCGKVGQAPSKHIVLRAIGPGRDVKADFQPIDLERGDKILICSDGLSNMLAEKELASLILAADSPELIKALPSELVAQANNRGAKDNVTALMMCFSSF